MVGGCNGNLKGICQLLQGMPAAEAIRRMEGTTCGPRATSCPDEIRQGPEGRSAGRGPVKPAFEKVLKKSASVETGAGFFVRGGVL